MDTSTHDRHTELVQQHIRQGLSHADAAAAATAALGAEGAASAAASREATADGGGSEEVPNLVPDAKRQKTEDAGGEHTGGEHAGDGATAAGGGLSSNAGGNKVDLPSGGDECGGESNAGKVKEGGSKGDTGGAGGESNEIARWDKAAAATPDDGVGFAMTDATLAEIEKLFKLIDVDESGTITLRDFQLQAAADGVEGERSDSGGSSLADSRFTQLLHYFDQDGDRCVLVCAV